MKPTLTLSPFVAAIFGWLIANAIHLAFAAYYLWDHPSFWPHVQLVAAATLLTCALNVSLQSRLNRPRTPLM